MRSSWKGCSLNLWDNGDVSKDRASKKKVDELGKNVDDLGASCLGGPSEPGMLAEVVGRVVSRPAVESVCESGSKGSSARYTNRTDGASSLVGPSAPGMLEGVGGRVVPRPAVESVCESGSKGSSARYTNRDGAIQLLPLLEEALVAVETRTRATSERKRHGATMVLEPLRTYTPGEARKQTRRMNTSLTQWWA